MRSHIFSSSKRRLAAVLSVAAMLLAIGVWVDGDRATARTDGEPPGFPMCCGDPK